MQEYRKIATVKAKLFEKDFPNESCPECGGNLTVKTKYKRC